MFSYPIPPFKLYRDPGKGKIIADSAITTTPIASYFQDIVNSQCCIESCKRQEISLRKMYIEGSLKSKSRNIALRCIHCMLCSLGTRRVMKNYRGRGIHSVTRKLVSTEVEAILDYCSS